MSGNFRPIDLTDPEWGTLKLLIAIPRSGDNWGVLAPLRGTAWGDQVAVVSGEVMSHALHGWATPLVRVLGPAPSLRARRIPTETGRCSLADACLGAGPQCVPGATMPDCYAGPDVEPDVAVVVAEVALAWKEGRHVVVVEGPEFSLS